MTVKALLKKIVPKKIRNLRHLFFAWWGSVQYKNPSKSLFVIGVTGTSGKSTTIHFLRQMLEGAGFTVGSLSTIDFSVAGTQQLNDKKMTMLGKTAIQKFLRDMVEAQCDIAIIETTSEGRVQHRHRWIAYDAMIITNLYEEHIESHGSFENYKQAKKDIFSYVSSLAPKNKTGLSNTMQKVWTGETVPKVFVLNTSIPQVKEFYDCSVGEKYLCTVAGEKKYFTPNTADRELILDTVRTKKEGISFTLNKKDATTHIFGEFNAMNMTLGIAMLQEFGISLEQCIHLIKKIISPPGRVEFIQEAKQHGFTAIVDYAFEPVAISGLYEIVSSLAPKRIIHVFGSTGGGRDVARRFSVGRFVGTKADICVVTNDDPYDDDPEKIIADIVSAALGVGKRIDETCFAITDRANAIQKAVTLAKEGDVVLITGKGSEQAMVFENGRMEPWDDREEVRKAITMR